MSVSSPIPSSLVALSGAEVTAAPAALSVTGVSFLLVVGCVGCVGVAQVADGAGGQIRQEEVVGAVHSEVLAHERAESGHVLVSDWVPLGLELADGGVKVDGRPQNHAIQNESEDAELVFKAPFVAVEQLALAAVADLAGQVVAAFLQVADVLDVAPVGLVGVDEGQDGARI
jgi:hypothetical protein